MKAHSIDEVVLDDVVDSRLQNLDELEALVIAMSREPGPIEPELERDLENLRVALLFVPEGLDVERRRVSSVRVAPP